MTDTTTDGATTRRNYKAEALERAKRLRDLGVTVRPSTEYADDGTESLVLVIGGNERGVSGWKDAELYLSGYLDGLLRQETA